MKTKILITLAAAIALPLNALAKDSYSGGHAMVSDEVIAHQRENLEKNTDGKGFGHNLQGILTRL